MKAARGSLQKKGRLKEPAVPSLWLNRNELWVFCLGVSSSAVYSLLKRFSCIYTIYSITVATSIWNTCVSSFPWSSVIVPCCLKPWWSSFCNLLLHQRRDCRAMALLRPRLGPKSWTRSPPQKWKWQVQVLQLGDVLQVQCIGSFQYHFMSASVHFLLANVLIDIVLGRAILQV